MMYIEVSRFIHVQEKSLKTHLITNNTKCDIYQCHFFVHFIYIYAQIEPLINKNKHFLTFTPSQQITKYT